VPTGADLSLSRRPAASGAMLASADGRRPLSWLIDPATGQVEPVPWDAAPGPQERMAAGWRPHERTREPELSYQEMLRELQRRAEMERMRKRIESWRWAE
jgi:hypothetical protein